METGMTKVTHEEIGFVSKEDLANYMKFMDLGDILSKYSRMFDSNTGALTLVYLALIEKIDTGGSATSILTFHNPSKRVQGRLVTILIRQIMKIRFGSVCSGIEAASVAWQTLGWEAAWFSEIDKFPCAVLKHHYPDIKNVGDMTLIPTLISSGSLEVPELLAGGTPCQAFSVAGQRRSLSDARGNLSLIFCEIFHAIRTFRLSHGQSEPILVWENVPGILYAKDNAFGCFLAGLLRSDILRSGTKNGSWPPAGWASYANNMHVAWRVLDAQHFGLAQRRKRVFVVASARKVRGGGGEQWLPEKVLFEPPSLPRNFEPRHAQKDSTSVFVEKGFGNYLNESDSLKCSTLKSGSGSVHGGSEALVLQSTYSLGGFAEYKDETHVSPLKAGTGDLSGGGEGLILLNTFIQKDSHCSNYQADKISPTLKAGGLAKNNSEVLILEPQGSSVIHQPFLRKLTPRECERLQGFPDDYTKIPYRGHSSDECPDGPRYKSIGNSWPIPVVRWIGQRIERVLSESKGETNETS